MSEKLVWKSFHHSYSYPLYSTLMEIYCISPFINQFCLSQWFYGFVFILDQSSALLMPVSLPYMLKCQCSISTAISLLNNYIDASPSLIHPSRVSLVTRIYKTCHIVLICPPCYTYMAEAQIPSLHPHGRSVDSVITCGYPNLIKAEIAIITEQRIYWIES